MVWVVGIFLSRLLELHEFPFRPRDFVLVAFDAGVDVAQRIEAGELVELVIREFGR